jgi:hypothetical protein
MAQTLRLKRFFFEFTRPSDTTAYAAQDSISDSTSAPSVITWTERPDPTKTYNQAGLRVGASYQIKSVKLTKNDNDTTNASFEMYFYTSGVTNTNDNSEYGITYADKVYRIGKTAFTLAAAGTTQSTANEQVVTDINHVFVAVGSTFFSTLVATAAYTPASGEKFYGEATLLMIEE